MKHALAIGTLLISATLGLAIVAARTEASPVTAPVEIWGVGSADRVEIDGAAVVPKAASARSFVGDPMAMNAPILRELVEGKHVIVVDREGCEPRRFAIDVQGALKRSIVLAEPNPERCQIPLAPPRSDAK